MKNDQVIKLQNIEKSFSHGGRERAVLQGVNEVFQPGEFVAIRGRSGSGKTTLLNLIAGIDEPTLGEILYGELDLTALTSKERTLFRREHIGFVFQFFNLIPTLTVKENVLLPAELANRKTARIESQAVNLLERVGLQGREDDFPDILSGGEQQRVAIARAVLVGPTVILADEPTGNLDRSTGADVLALLNNIRRDYETTLIMVTHSHSLADQADRTLSIENGVLTPLSAAAKEA
ncbi:MAG: ABC transporter ATP-binding protein [Anaerolineales bacterium]|nr:ABC transporter ATP-binding protein [Anaerolineales bacterium]